MFPLYEVSHLQSSSPSFGRFGAEEIEDGESLFSLIPSPHVERIRNARERRHCFTP